MPKCTSDLFAEFMLIRKETASERHYMFLIPLCVKTFQKKKIIISASTSDETTFLTILFFIFLFSHKMKIFCCLIGVSLTWARYLVVVVVVARYCIIHRTPGFKYRYTHRASFSRRACVCESGDVYTPLLSPSRRREPKDNSRVPHLLIIFSLFVACVEILESFV